MEQITYDAMPFTGMRRSQLSATGNKLRLVLTTKGNIGSVEILAATGLYNKRFQPFPVKCHSSSGNEVLFTLHAGVYQVHHWDGVRDHLTYLKVDEYGNQVASWSVTLGAPGAQAWLRGEFPCAEERR
jgi:hypothetical protein